MQRKESGSQGRKRRKEKDIVNVKASKQLCTWLQNSNTVLSSLSSEIQDVQHQDIEDEVIVVVHDHVTEMNEVSDVADDCDGDVIHASNCDVTDEMSENENLSKHEANIELFFRDVGEWPRPVPKDLKCEFVRRGSQIVCNEDAQFSKNKDGRSLSKEWFTRVLPNGTSVRRSWLCYSCSKLAAFCFPCILFLSKQISSFNSAKGFSSWKKLNPRINEHENSSVHKKAFQQWKTLEIALKCEGTIDIGLQKQLEEEKRTWIQILRRVLDVILHLTKTNQALRGHNESLHGSRNAGNFLETVKLLAKYDTLLETHLQNIFEKKESVTYLSPKIQNEFITLIAKNVRSTILNQIREAKYYSIMFDTTPDVSHIEQMSQVVRYVQIETNGTVTILESFIGFIICHGKSGEAIADEIVGKIKDDQLSLQDCRGQCYDNAPNMSGKNCGVQTRISNLNPLARYVPCSAHSLNLIGVHASQVTVESVTFFDVIEKLFVFFSASTHRWEVLKHHVHIVLKGHCDTRWSSKEKAVSAIATQLTETISALNDLINPSETPETRFDAKVLIDQMSRFSFFAHLHFWHVVLKSVNVTNKSLQIAGDCLEDSALHLTALLTDLEEKRETEVQKSVKYAETMCANLEVDVQFEKRRQKRKKMPGEIANDDGFNMSPQQKMIQLLNEVLDNMIAQMNQRFERIVSLRSDFGFLNCNHLISNYESNEDDLNKQATVFAQKYPTDVDGNELFEEVKRIRHELKAFYKDKSQRRISTKDFLEFITKLGLQEIYPNLTTSLRIYLTLPVSVASCERAFSKLKLIKSYLRSSMSQARLNDLAIISIEQEVSNTVQYASVIADFAAAKCRKRTV